MSVTINLYTVESKPKLYMELYCHGCSHFLPRPYWVFPIVSVLDVLGCISGFHPVSLIIDLTCLFTGQVFKRLSSTSRSFSFLISPSFFPLVVLNSASDFPKLIFVVT